jgi:hypothetical protein
MSQKSHQDPITYHAYGKVLGIYKPSNEDLTKGNLTTEDGTIFPATLTGEALAEVEQNINRLNQIGIWRCYFRTRPHSLQLIRVKFDNLEYAGKIGVDDFRVVGEVVKIEKQSVTVRIKKNKGTAKAFYLLLKGTFDCDPTYKFYLFELKREGKSYSIVRWKKAGLLSLPQKEKQPKQSEVLRENHRQVIVKIIKKQ